MLTTPAHVVQAATYIVGRPPNGGASSCMPDLPDAQGLAVSACAGCDVLWGGCPMVTLPLERMASRVAASLCYATGLGAEMVVSSQQVGTLLCAFFGAGHPVCLLQACAGCSAPPHCWFSCDLAACKPEGRATDAKHPCNLSLHSCVPCLACRYSGPAA